MTENILQSYANHNLLDFEGGGNEEYEHLLKASEILADKITNENIQAFALAAINPHVDIENIQLQEIQKIIQEEWKLFVKSTKQTDIQRTILRAVILNTLDYLIENDDKKAAILWLSCQHVYQYANISTKRPPTEVGGFNSVTTGSRPHFQSSRKKLSLSSFEESR